MHSDILSTITTLFIEIVHWSAWVGSTIL